MDPYATLLTPVLRCMVAQGIMAALGHCPHLELTARAGKSTASVLRHMLAKCGPARDCSTTPSSKPLLSFNGRFKIPFFQLSRTPV
jgi:hypothetical protein